MNNATRTGHIGNCYEYAANGKRFADTDRMTIDQMIELSRQWPSTYHEHVGTNGYVTYAHAGKEIPVSELPFK